MQAVFAADGQGRPLLDLRHEARTHRPQLRDLPALDAEERAMAQRTWLGRMVNEHVSAQVFASLVPQLMRAALPPALQAEVPAMIADEYRHACLCAGVVEALGGTALAPLPEVTPLPAHDDVGPLEAVLRNVLSVGCLSETVAVAVIRAEHAELEGTALGAVLGGILADEIQHARFGWRVLGLLAPRLDDGARARLSAYLEDVLEHQIRWEVPRLPVHRGLRPEVVQAGVCDGHEARLLFFDTIETVVLPQLERAGLVAWPAWNRALERTRAVWA